MGDDPVSPRSAADLVAERSRAKSRAYRSRVAAGRVVLRLEVDEVELVEALVHDRLLDHAAVDDRRAVEAAVQDVLRRYVQAPRAW